ncbi:unnamed protein product [Clonostachys chloroleuca]|uniref:TPR repeat-containing protein n=1 Tax=Clonostachys chloroleuca TaxID=1926264 RepID=A0AA35M0D6_9HYPO|nr:unnamed protein product [Clonostachys chloroleuca]
MAADSKYEEALLAVLASGSKAEAPMKGLIQQLASAEGREAAIDSPLEDVFGVGVSALDVFLQANVTGPVLPEASVRSVEKRFLGAWAAEKQGATTLDDLRKACLRELEVDGVSPYAYIPHLELFALAKYIFTKVLRNSTQDLELPSPRGGTQKYSTTWMRLRVNTWHYKLLTQPSLGPGSNFTRSSQWSEVPTLAGAITDGIEAVGKQLLSEDVWAAESEGWAKEDKVMFLVEAANNYILLGRNDLARETLDKASKESGLLYELSGALGKRTKFQEKNISQLVVLAKSAATTGSEKEEDAAKPEDLKLNDDTLLEEIKFSKEENGQEAEEKKLPSALADLSPDDQPQLSPLDQIILLTEATLKDAFSPVDTLTSEEILPYAVRVLADKSTNWQIYTQALLVRSRIEVHRSRTVERGVLQLQAVADQVLTDTTASSSTTSSEESDKLGDAPDVPAIQVDNVDEPTPPTTISKPTSFLPAPKPSESAPAHIRLQYIHTLSTPPRWHLESELAYAWAGIGSLVSALEIFKRLRLWAEVALCLASSAAAAEQDEDGRGSGGEEKAKGIIRWRLFHRTGETAETAPSDADEEKDIGDPVYLKGADFSGPARSPPPPNAPRLWCILGDLESDASYYERAWEISKHRYARAQKSLGEHYIQKREWENAQEAYKKATSVNRLSSDMWSRLGDICLRLANFEDAAEAFNRSISSATDLGGGEGARTWSNLGSALWSLYCEVIAETKVSKPEETETAEKKQPADEEEDDDLPATSTPDEEKTVSRDPKKLLAQAFAAYKKGASIAHDNWRIWDNVLTLSSRIRPPPVPDMILALRNILRIRKTEDAVDADLLSALLQDVVLSKDKDSSANLIDGIYEPPRGSPERLVTRLLEEDVLPLITHRSELWSLLARLRAWRRDYAGAIDASERAWRAAMGSSSSSSGLSASSSAAGVDWTTDKSAWETVVMRTDELASMLENWGPDVPAIGAKWKGKVRSAVRSVMGKGREHWEDSEGWRTLQNIMDALKAER